MSNATVNQAIINCVYVNRTEKTAILKIDFMGQWLERVVEPGQDFCFNAPEGGYLDIFTYEMAAMIREHRIPCRELAI
ncbi:MAG: DUF1830 domain-containing protein [Microcystis sp. M04BS1]|uniref:DUF1830 domain-containing protein n=1 Tax=Microcystis aeruginosa Ma_MB_F_20061100_S20D TaxID=2486253 RepID=A0A552EZ87_MICAE|nr:DUF1830 domain-containing protein [Microcystis sp. M04BS1]TRU38982.1 MAG: DUF1830 domain-containing protein [Microcystis aeruginosa Ma_MB_F_20061100_S20]TRU39777.1 MAG: DUF1830 domain-containing protein [Microcystis aeruginosa Ma_MB_F_20061100_S20D]